MNYMNYKIHKLLVSQTGTFKSKHGIMYLRLLKATEGSKKVYNNHWQVFSQHGSTDRDRCHLLNVCVLPVTAS